MAKGASLNPADMLSGGRVPDGRYTIKQVTAEVFDYGGKANEVPAACIVFKGTDGTEHEQYYSAGDAQYLTPSEDKSSFVHPRGEQAKLSLNSNFGKFMQAMIGAGFPVVELSDKLACIAGADVELVGQAQPKNQSGKESVLSLPTKYYGKGKGTGARPTGAGTPARTAPAAQKPATSPAPAASAPVNGQPADLDAEAVIRIQAVLTSAPEKDGLKSITLARLGPAVMMACAREKSPNTQAIKKLATDPAWMGAQGEVGGWLLDGDNVVLIA